MNNRHEPIDRYQFEAQKLMTEYPPIWRDRNKEIVFGIACPPGSIHGGVVDYSRWGAMPLPLDVDPSASARRLVSRPGFYDYREEEVDSPAIEWHVNFADPHLFVAYASALFAQDEMQVAEHPVLGALKEALTAIGARALTIEGGAPTPVLIKGVQRRCCVATDTNGDEGRPGGLYGNAFARADEAAVRLAAEPIDPPTTTNILAMAALSGGYGRYTRRQIQDILTTAFTGFAAAVLESQRNAADAIPVVVHTGFWGCGAFGGNRVLMATLQLLAAEMAAAECIVFHAGDGAGSEALESAKRLCERELVAGRTRVIELIDRLESIGFEWGVSDGN